MGNGAEHEAGPDRISQRTLTLLGIGGALGLFVLMVVVVNGVVNGHWTVVGTHFTDRGNPIIAAALFLTLVVAGCVGAILLAVVALCVAWKHRQVAGGAARQRHERHLGTAPAPGRTGAGHPTASGTVGRS